MTENRLLIDHVRCCGYGACVEQAPTVFALSGTDGLAELLRQPVAEEEAAVEQAMGECPTEAISRHTDG
jgi:ferredoxin